MRNVFDQYEQAENRLTHGLAVALAEDSRLLRDFVTKVARVPLPKKARLVVEEQGLPGESGLSEAEAERRGLPDAWIHDGESWSLLIETKLTARLTADQLRRHIATARRRGFTDVHLVALTARPEAVRLPEGCRMLSWKTVYAWLRRHDGRSEWAARVAEYLEIVEARMSEREDSFEGVLTEFTGFPFGPDRPWNYGEAKRLLRLAMEELRKRKDLERKLGMNPRGQSRKAITGKGSRAVWDFLSLRAATDARQHTEMPHLTLSIGDEAVWAHMTCPNQFRGKAFGRRGLERDEFVEALGQVERNMRPVVKRAPGCAPWFGGLQRHFRGQRSDPISDGRLEFDLRTVAVTPHKGSVKPQPAWLDAAWEALQNRKPNFQMAVGLLLPYRRCAAVRERGCLDLLAEAWIATMPLLDTLVHRGNPK